MSVLVLCYLSVSEQARGLMQRLETSLPGVLELRPLVHRDGRGFFTETYHQAKFADLGIPDTFVQDNHSRSSKGTLRGLHYQLHHPQAKICRVAEGEALDVVVDIRLGSPNFGKWTSVLLSSEEQNQIFVPAGFAHGFLAITDTVQFLYKCSDFYNPGDEHGIAWNDSDLEIRWGVTAPVISARDAAFPPLAKLSRESLPELPAK
ncbi:MAG: dTDP-4-dehydrorhamnose 3,5-epimerase [Candidatus Acidiferrum sp.]